MSSNEVKVSGIVEPSSSSNEHDAAHNVTNLTLGASDADIDGYAIVPKLLGELGGTGELSKEHTNVALRWSAWDYFENCGFVGCTLTYTWNVIGVVVSLTHTC